MGEINTYKDLHAWQVGMQTIELTYAVTAHFPNEERYGLVAQMRRASVSIPSNVAEGHGVGAARWSLRYVRTAIGSSLELATQLEAAVRLKMVSREETQPLAASIDRVQKLLYGMRRQRLAQIGATAGAGIVLLAVLLATSI